MLNSFYFFLVLITAALLTLIVIWWLAVILVILTPGFWSKVRLVSFLLIFFIIVMLVTLFFTNTKLFYVGLAWIAALLFIVLSILEVLAIVWYNFLIVFLYITCIVLPWLIYKALWVLYHTWIDFVFLGCYYLYIYDFLDNHFTYPGRFFRKRETIKKLIKHQIFAIIIFEVPLPLALVSFFGSILYALLVYDFVINPRDVFKHPKFSVSTVVCGFFFLLSTLSLLFQLFGLYLWTLEYIVNECRRSMEEEPDELDVVNTVLEFLRRDKTEVPSEPAPERVTKPYDPYGDRLRMQAKLKARYEAKYGKPNERDNDEEDESGDDEGDDD